MRKSWFAASLVVACALGWFGRSVWSEDPPMDKEAWMKLATPGEQHARLKAFAGEWVVHGKMTEGDKVTESEGTSTMTMILDGRFLRQEVRSTFEGMPFEGRGIMGYDNGKKKYVSAWVDTMGTGIMFGEGEETTPGKVWTMHSVYEGGPQGKMTMREVVTLVNDKEFTWEAWMGDAPKPMMSLHYRRK